MNDKEIDELLRSINDDKELDKAEGFNRSKINVFI